MRRSLALLSLVMLAAIPSSAETGDQSYITFDDGMTVLRQADDGREVEARVNLPLFAGDELQVGRRGRTEIRLADGNVIAIDRDSVLRLGSLANTFDAADQQTVAELRYGAAIVHLLDAEAYPLRLDTPAASYVSVLEGIYSVESDARGADQVTVHSGAIEVRTPARTSRLRAGESAKVDASGIYAVTAASASESAFERWYLRRAERYRGESRYLDRSLSYVERDLDDYGHWVYASDYGWTWRPYVSAGWRPYHNGHWRRSPYGAMVWVSYEPWGWGPYHYGRWMYDAFSGWFWMPGSLYSPAWVYWAYGPSYIGWIPSGWYDCYRPWRNYRNNHDQWAWNDSGVGIGFYGRVNLRSGDLSGWTFVDSKTFVSTRMDRAALKIDDVRARLARDGDSAVLSNAGGRFTRDDLGDPASAANGFIRRTVGGGTGKEGSGSLADLNSFFRRDPELSPEARETVTRGNVRDAARRIVLPSAPAGSRDATADSGRVARPGVGGGSAVPERGGDPRVISRLTPSAPSATPRTDGPGSGSVVRPRPSTSAPAPSEPAEPRGAIRRPVAPAPAAEDRTEAPSRSDSDAWRGRAVTRPRTGSTTPRTETAPPSDTPAPRTEAAPRSDWRRGSESTEAAPIPRRVIDTIGGARMVPRQAPRADSPRGRSSSGGGRERAIAPRPSSGSSSGSGSVRSRPSSSSGSSSRGSVARPSSGSSSRSGGSISRPGSGSSSSSRGSSSSPSSSRSGGSRGSTTIKKD